MRAFTAILLASAFLLQPASKLLILVHYQVNKQFISQNLCENRAKPTLHCNGKCHLKKQLQKDDKKDSSSSTKEKSGQNFWSQKKITILIYIFPEKPQMHFTYLDKSYTTISGSIFHPPCFA